MADEVPFLVMKGIQKRFPGVLALDSVDFVCQRGEIHGLIGENGAGKSTLIKILSGVLQPDAGEILLQGKPVKMISPSRAASLGISVIHQELNLIEDLTVAQNICLGHEPRRAMGILDLPAMYASAREYLKIVGLDIHPQVKVRALSLEQKQLVEIAKALSLDARILIMDEPTAALNAEEVERLLRLMRHLAERGCGVIFISHRLEEVFAVADRITILRDGKVVATRAKEEIDPETAVRMMTGKAQGGTRIIGSIPPRERPLLEVKGLTLSGAFYDVSFRINEGEIVGMVGLEGQGQREIPRAIFGELRPTKGEIYLRGTRLRLTSPREAIKAGIVFVPEERKAEGLCLSLDVRQNIALATLDRRQVAGFVRLSNEAKLIRNLVEQLKIQLASPLQEARSLSGGNQQKVVIAKWLCTRPTIFLFSEPTRGIDVGAKEEIYRLIRRQADEGSGVLIVSSDLMEVLRLCDRILVVYDGRIVKEMAAEEADKEKIMTAQWGLKEASP
ncbi:MAG: sugar ABC transporter ATP-binding protein [Bacillota bacterium]